VRQLPEICSSCRREIRTLERCIIDYSGACYGVTYNPSDLGAIRPDSPWNLANIEDSYSRCTIGDALWRAGVLPAAPYGYYWTEDYTLVPAY
jgi:hypothetical protein